MKILFITQYFPPEIGAAANRIAYFAHYLAKKGHEVSVLTGTPNYPEGKVYPGFSNTWSEQRENNVTVYRTRILLTAKAGSISRISHYLSFVISSVAAKRKIPKPDIIFASSPPLFTALIGVIFKKLWHVPLITDIRDLWPESIESVGAVKHGILLKQVHRLAQYIYRNSDQITVTSPGIQKNIPLLEAIRKRIEILPNGAELDLFRPDINGDDIRRAWNLGQKFVVLYTGNLGLAQAPEIFIKTAEVLREKTEIIFLIVGAGILLHKLQKEAAAKRLINIIFTGNQPRNRMPHFVAAADICIIPYKKADTFRSTYPSKMFDYMAGARPIIINLKGEASELMESSACGVLAKEEDSRDMAEKILALTKNPEKAKDMGQSGRIFVEQHYSREVTAERLAQLIHII